jgi:hypothetical protein
VDEARLANTGLSRYPNDLAMSGPYPFQHLRQALHFGRTPDEGREPVPRRPRHQTRARWAGARKFVGFHRVAQTLDWDGSAMAHFYKALRQAKGLTGDQHRGGRGGLLDACREMRRLADGRIVHVEIVADGTNDDLARIKPDSDLHVDSVRAADVLRVALHRVLHP